MNEESTKTADFLTPKVANTRKSNKKQKQPRRQASPKRPPSATASPQNESKARSATTATIEPPQSPSRSATMEPPLLSASASSWAPTLAVTDTRHNHAPQPTTTTTTTTVSTAGNNVPLLPRQRRQRQPSRLQHDPLAPPASPAWSSYLSSTLPKTLLESKGFVEHDDDDQYHGTTTTTTIPSAAIPVYRLILDGQATDGSDQVNRFIQEQEDKEKEDDQPARRTRRPKRRGGEGGGDGPPNDTPLLHHALSNNETDKSSTTSDGTMAIYLGSVANLCSATLGAGILSLPIALYQSGLVVGGILLIASGLATLASIHLLIKVCEAYRVYTYEGLVETVLGRWARTLTELCIVIFCVGCAVAYVIAVGDILQQAQLILPASMLLGDDNISDRRAWSMVLVWLFCMLPLSLLRTMQHLQFASIFGIASIGTLVFSTLIHMIQDYEADPTTGNGTTTNTTDWPLSSWGMDDGSSAYDSFWSSATNAVLHALSSNSSMRNRTHYYHFHHPEEPFSDFVWPSNGWTSVLTACPIIMFAYSCQVNVCAIYQELPDTSTAETATGSNHSQQEPLADRCVDEPRSPTNTDLEMNHDMNNTAASGLDRPAWMHLVALGQLSLCSLLYASIACFALADFGSHVTPNILSAYNVQDSPMMQVAMAAMAAAVITAFPLNIFPARDSLSGMLHLCPSCSDVASTSSNSSQGLQVHLLSVSPNPTLTAALLEDQDQTIEGTEPAPTSAGLEVNSVSNTEQIEAPVDVAESYPNGDMESSQKLPQQQQIQENATLMYERDLENGGEDTAVVLEEMDQPQSLALALPFKHHVILTLLLCGMSLGLGLLVPDLATVFGLLGGTTSSALGFCIPGALGIQLCRRPDHAHDIWTLVLSWFLLLGGAVVGVLTTAVTVYEKVTEGRVT